MKAQMHPTNVRLSIVYFTSKIITRFYKTCFGQSVSSWESERDLQGRTNMLRYVLQRITTVNQCKKHETSWRDGHRAADETACVHPRTQ